MIRIGRIKNSNDRLSYENFTPIVVMTKCSKYASLSPYVLRDEDGNLVENIWHSSKIFEKVPAIKCPYSQYDRRVIWEWPEETHIDENGLVKNEYWVWRANLRKCPDPVRYPAGYHNRKMLLFRYQIIMNFCLMLKLGRRYM